MGVRRALAFILSGLIVQSACLAVASAEEADTSGRKIILGIPSSPGGAYDGYSRLLTRHISRHLSGNPTVIAQNVPAGGGLVLVNQLFNTAPRDGTYFAMVRTSTLYEEVYGNSAVKFEGRKLTWLGNLNADRDTCVTWHTSGINSFADLYTREAVVGSAGAGAMSASMPLIYNEFLGTKFKVILGYRGTPERILAMEKGELQANCGLTTVSLRTTGGQNFTDGKIRVLVQAGLTPDPAFPDVPNILDEAKTPEARQALEFVFLQMELGRPYAAPPSLPPEAAQRLRTAFMATTRDAEFLAEAKKLQLDIGAIDGAATAERVGRIYSTPKAIADRVGAAMTKSGN
ncbi:MAG TPA: tripartite tricarboxylate transporter substrate-binding protein [Alphaproteobacteria bacterium]|jgi:tripartite-type tricarboxylate transporter receptor subunit TctC|nr:tripartite tricarboxylate transporter substrate-binding protein [Alphaproteobacteria bacterium]